LGLTLFVALAVGTLPLRGADEPAAGQADHAAAGDAADAHGASHGEDGSHGAHDPFEEALHGNAGPDLENPAEVRTDLAIWTFVVFALLLTGLWKFAWGPLAASLDRRERSILANIEQAKQQNEQAKKLLSDHEARLAGAADEVRRIVDDARRDADAQKQQILAEAQAAAQSEKRRALQEIEAAKNGALQELAEKSVATAVGLAGRIVQRQLSSDDHASLIAEALERFPSQN
jgi:F-type H+-transporting ATPase subunit b